MSLSHGAEYEHEAVGKVNSHSTTVSIILPTLQNPGHKVGSKSTEIIVTVIITMDQDSISLQYFSVLHQAI